MLLDNSQSQPLKSPSQNSKQPFKNNSWKWLGLALACILSLSRYYASEITVSLQTPLEDVLNINGVQYNLFNSIYSFPNILIPLFGGYAMDYLGDQICIIIFTTLLIFGEGIQTLGASLTSYEIMIIGKFIFACGGDCSLVIQKKIIYKWFNENEYSFATSFILVGCRLGSMMNSLLSSRIYNWTNMLYFPFLIGTCICIISFICGLILGWMDSKSYMIKNMAINDNINTTIQVKKVKLNDIKKFTKLFWTMAISCAISYTGFYVFLGVSNQFLEYKFNINYVTAGEYMTIFFISAAGLTPFLGKLIDKLGQRAFAMIISNIILTITHAYFAFDPWTSSFVFPIIGLVLLGISLALFSSTFWGALLLVVQKESVGTAIGLVTCIENFALAITPMFVGYIQDQTEYIDSGYFWVSILLMIISFFGILAAILVQILDTKNGKRLSNVQKLQKISF